MAQQSESFGPFSEPIDISEFIKSAQKLASEGHDVWYSKRLPTSSWCALPAAAQGAIERECQLEDILTETTNFLENDPIRAYLIANRLDAINALYRETDRDKRRKRKRVGEAMQSEFSLHPDVLKFRQCYSGDQLSWFKLPPDATHFVRKSKTYEYNALSMIKSVSPLHESDLESSNQTSENVGLALLTITVYDRAIASPYYVHRSSTHVLHSSQTLGDLYEIIPCPSKEQPSEVRNTEGHLTGYNLKEPEMTGCVICVAGVAYGDSLEIEDYADKLCQYLRNITKEQPPSVGCSTPSLRRGNNIHDVAFDTLKLSLHFPNWILHHGSCEHYFTVDQIRLQHPSDPQLGYPLTLYVAPPSRGKCRLCENLPAAFSLVNDLRMPDTPFLICKDCMALVGTTTNEDAIVVPLVEHYLW